jgi:hypothetical protein
MNDVRRRRLKVYLGAAPGVGKTYRMLDEARRRAGRGADVVVAFAECHGRPVTEAMLDGLETVPRARCSYRGGQFEELDLAAVLARRPTAAIVDEFAHTNVPGGGRNPKRRQDIEELLAAGVDVITAVNVQHLESLKDVVEKITGVPQHETVPDEVVRRAHQIELVDIPPEGLRRRMAHGNIYAPEKDRRRPRQLLPARQSDRAAAAGAAVAGRPGRRGAQQLSGRARHRHRGVGVGAGHPGHRADPGDGAGAAVAAAAAQPAGRGRRARRAAGDGCRDLQASIPSVLTTTRFRPAAIVVP